jgi:ubiquinone/menaquinone biosynthesis C-methylase UbiE
MNHADHVDLLRLGVAPGGIWADLGSGTGAFTLALAELLGPEGVIHSVDKDPDALAAQKKSMRRRFPRHEVHFHKADFTRPLDLRPLDGMVIANALHFVRNKAAVLPDLVSLLRPGGRFILVEYNVDRGNEWVPHPVSYGRWEYLASHAGLRDTMLIGSKPSRFLGEIYSAGSTRER